MRQRAVVAEDLIVVINLHHLRVELSGDVLLEGRLDDLLLQHLSKNEKERKGADEIYFDGHFVVQNNDMELLPPKDALHGLDCKQTSVSHKRANTNLLP